MRLLLFFDLPTITNKDKKIYRDFIKFLKEEGFMMVQYSVYSKLCINTDSTKTELKRIRRNCPENGNVRVLPITENQYQNIININNTFSLQESITTTNRVLMIGGMNNDN